MDHLHRHRLVAGRTGLPHRPRQGHAGALDRCERAADQAQREYIKSVAAPAGSSATEEIAKAAQLKEQGVISEDEFNAIKTKALG